MKEEDEMTPSNDIKHLDWREVIKAQEGTDAAVCAALDAYFEPFAALPGEVTEDGSFKIAPGQPCINCGEGLSDGMMALMGFSKGGFEWGITHGEGHCRNCGWPTRAYHFIKDADGNDLMTLRGVLLQYHPDYVEKRAASAIAEEETREEAE